MGDYVNVVETILEQLGGRMRLKLMIGAKTFVADKGRYGLGRLSITFPSNLTKPRANVMRVELTYGDLYEIEFDYVSVAKGTSKTVAKADEVFVGDLAETIRKLTGLEIRIPNFTGG